MYAFKSRMYNQGIRTLLRNVMLLGLLIMPRFNILTQDTVSQLEFPLNYNAEDSIVVDIKGQKAYLYNNAHIDYGSYKLDACFIEFDFKTKNVKAKLCLDSVGNPYQIPSLSDGDTETAADSLAFNFESKRGITYQVKMQEGQGYIHGNKVKRQGNGEIHIDTALYTTCNLDHPHYYFKLRKAIIIPNDKIVSGPINLFVADIPTPLGLPFAFIPNQEKRTNGIIIPQYGNSASQGFFLSRGGYYHKFKNDQYAMKFLGDIFTKGSWGLTQIIDYKKRYKSNGRLELTFRKTKLGEPEFDDFSVSNDFLIKWNHVQDPKSIPSMTFRASLEAGTSTIYENNVGTQQLNSQDYLKNNFNSNIAWSKTFKKLPSNLSVNLRHNQNSNNGLVTFTLPDVTYSVNRFYPTKGIKTGNAVKSDFRKQVDKIGVTYVSNFKGESKVFEENLRLDDMGVIGRNAEFGGRQKVNLATSMNLGPFTLTPNMNASMLNYWYKMNQSYDTVNAEIDYDTVRAFYNPIWANYGASLTTKVYGFYEFAEFLQGKRESKVRHVITPSVSFALNPENSYQQSYFRDSLEVFYSPYQGQLFGSPAFNSSGNLNFSLINAFELRQNNLNDTTGNEPYVYRKLLDNLTFSSGYNLLADSVNWSPVNISGRTNIAGKLSTRFGATLNPYEKDSLNRNTNQFLTESTGSIFDVSSAFVNFGFNLKSKRKEKKLESEYGSEEELEYVNSNRDEFIQFGDAWQWDLNVGYNINYTRLYRFEEPDSSRIIQAITLNGSVNLTKNMNFNFQTNYDLRNKQFSFTSFNLRRGIN